MVTFEMCETNISVHCSLIQNVCNFCCQTEICALLTSKCIFKIHKHLWNAKHISNGIRKSLLSLQWLSFIFFVKLGPMEDLGSLYWWTVTQQTQLPVQLLYARDLISPLSYVFAAANDQSLSKLQQKWQKVCIPSTQWGRLLFTIIKLSSCSLR